MTSKADLHVHSKFSHASPEWVLRKANFPHCSTPPARLYEALRQRGMDFVTITDHDCIDGCLEIADRSGVFVSEEVTTFFPEDHCQVHLLVWNIQESQHAAIRSLRKNLYELQAYLRQENIAHAVAHPLKSYDLHFGQTHFEKLLLLFSHFETINGLCDGLFSEVANAIVTALTAADMERLADRHGITPVGQNPWPRFRVGGSNDHSELVLGAAYTETPACHDAAEFVRLVANGQCQPRGTNGSPVSIAHTVYQNAYHFLDGHAQGARNPALALLAKALQRFVEGENPTNLSLAEKLSVISQSIRAGKVMELAKSGTSPLVRELAQVTGQREFQARLRQAVEPEPQPERRAFLTANAITDQLAFRLMDTITKKLRAGAYLESLEQLGSLLPVALALAPYSYVFHSHTARQSQLRRIAQSALGKDVPPLQNDRRAWFTDTLYDVNGVSTTIRKMTSEAAKAGKDLTVITCSAEAKDMAGLPVLNFAPIGEFEVPEYEMQRVAFPPLLRVIEHVQRLRYQEIIISTPGPVGLCGLLAAKLLGIKTVSIYHTDFPQYVNILTDDSFLETLTWRFMHWFYDLTDVVYVNSEHYRQQWISRGIAPEKIATLPRGLDLELFQPSKRDPAMWDRYGRKSAAPVILYVGRVSKEKDLDVLANAGELLQARGLAFELAIVGDGPYLKEIRRKIPQAMTTGILAGEDLARAYASADLFAFPSTTDTYGNVVVEALASGVPCVVSDVGGPKDLVREGETGLITRGLDAADFARGLGQLLGDRERMEAMRIACRQSVADRDWAAALQRFWAR